MKKAKNLVLGPIFVHLAQIRAANFFPQNRTISEKTNDPILRKLSDGQTDETDFIGSCPANVERPKIQEK